MLTLKKQNEKQNESATLFPISDDERRKLERDLGDLVVEFVKIEEEKASANAEFAHRLNATWTSILLIEARLRHGG